MFGNSVGAVALGYISGEQNISKEWIASAQFKIEVSAKAIKRKSL